MSLRPKRHRIGSILLGIAGMTATVAVMWLIVATFAGQWGVPFFSFTTANGSNCKNDFAGYQCSKVTLKDFEQYAKLKLPPGSKLSSATYEKTHDYRVTGTVITNKANGAAMVEMLNARFGKACTAQAVPEAVEANRAAPPCVRTTAPLSTGAKVKLPQELYTVISVLKKDGSTMTTFDLRSR